MRVLYATDGRAPARYAGRLIASTFDPTRVQVDVLTVMPERPKEWVPHDRYQERRLDVPPFDEGNELARAAADSLDAVGFSTTFRSAEGVPAEAILEAAEDHDAIVLGGSHTAWMGNALLGSTSMYVLHHAPCSVAIVHEPPENERVIVGIDGSDEADAAVEFCGELLDPTRCEVDVIIAVGHEVPLVVPPYFGGFATNATVVERNARERIERGRRSVQAASRRLAAKGFDVDEVVLEGAAGPQLLKEVDNVDAGLLVVGSRGMGALRRTLLGSVSDQVVRHAPATLVVRRRPAHG